MIIDAWIQHPTSRLISLPIFDSLRKWIKDHPTSEFPIDFTIQAMDEAEVEKALICAWESPSGSLVSNKEVYQWVEKYPDRLVGVAAVNLNTPMQAVRELRRCVKEYNFKALRMLPWIWEKPCTHRLYYPLFAECVELNIPVCLQVGLTGPLMSSETGQPLHIERVALDFPELKIVCGHIGYPWHNEMIVFARKFPNVYIDTSAYKTNRYPAELIQYMKGSGKHKVLFASDHPMITPKECLKNLDQLELSDEVKDLFLKKNTKKVFNL